MSLGGLAEIVLGLRNSRGAVSRLESCVHGSRAASRPSTVLHTVHSVEMAEAATYTNLVTNGFPGWVGSDAQPVRAQ